MYCISNVDTTSHVFCVRLGETICVQMLLNEQMFQANCCVQCLMRQIKGQVFVQESNINVVKVIQYFRKKFIENKA